MKYNTLVTYSLLSHLKETNTAEYSSMAELFFPIVKKAIVEYATEHGNNDVKGEHISEIKDKILSFFGIDIPLSVLDFILSQISKEISDERKFVYFKDKGFIINAFVFNDIDDKINVESDNVESLKMDYEEFCNFYNYESNFDDLITFICSQKLELFASKKKEDLDFSFHIPKYVSLKFNDEKYYKVISDIYLGSLISSYFEYKIDTPVSNTELLIDTNFFISLINLNTYESYLTCNQLFDVGMRLGYKFSILYTTIEEIKVLLSSRIQDFPSKDLGLIKEADIFGACIRRNLSKTQLERIKDDVDSKIRNLGIDIIYEARIKDLVNTARKSDKYLEILELRKHQKLSALNDTIAYFYVNKRRGTHVNEFADVKCWFLNNTFHSDYYSSIGYKLHERYKISANELLSLLWLSNPNQDGFDVKVLSKGGLATFIAKYKHQKSPSINTIKDIRNRAKQAQELGKLTEKDVFNISIRMSEGQLTNGEATDLAKLPDDDFINLVKKFSKNDEEILLKINEQKVLIEKQNRVLEELRNQSMENRYQLALERFEINKDKFVDSQLPRKMIKINSIAWGYIVFVLVISSIWLINYLNFKIIGPKISGGISFLLFLLPLPLRFVNHEKVLKCLKFTFFHNYRLASIEEFRESYEKEYEKNNEKPEKKIFME